MENELNKHCKLMIPVIDDKAPAYWIAPDGRIIPIYKTHIDSVFDCPEAFGYSLKEIKKLYNESKEKYRIEGKARNVIVENLTMNKGWIRIRFLPVNDTYHIEIGPAINQYKNFLWLWAKALIKTVPRKALSRVLICKFGARKADFAGSLQELVDFKLFNSDGMGCAQLTPVKSSHDLLKPLANVSNSLSGYMFSEKFKIPDIEDASAYWISPIGKILKVGITHVDVICDCPEAFGFALDEVKAVYKKFGEPLRSEAHARDFLIEKALKDGWTRIRFNPMEDVYHIELNELTNKYKDYLWAWAEALTNVNQKRVYAGVLLYEYNSDNFSEGTIRDIKDFKLFSSCGMGFHLLIPVKSACDFLADEQKI